MPPKGVWFVSWAWLLAAAGCATRERAARPTDATRPQVARAARVATVATPLERRYPSLTSFRRDEPALYRAYERAFPGTRRTLFTGITATRHAHAGPTSLWSIRSETSCTHDDDGTVGRERVLGLFAMRARTGEQPPSVDRLARLGGCRGRGVRVELSDLDGDGTSDLVASELSETPTHGRRLRVLAYRTSSHGVEELLRDETPVASPVYSVIASEPVAGWRELFVQHVRHIGGEATSIVRRLFRHDAAQRRYVAVQTEERLIARPARPATGRAAPGNAS